MIIALVFSVIAICFAWLNSIGKFKSGLKFSIFIVFIFLALRFDYGNDYQGYLDLFLNINFNSTDLSIKGNEIGWLYFNKFFYLLFGKVGFFAQTIALAAFSTFVLFRFIKKYVPVQYYWFAVFYYVFNFEIMLIQCTAMRQAVAITLFLLAFDFIIERNILKFLLLIFAATLFHSSAYFLILLLVITFLKFRVRKIYIIATLGIFASMFIYYKQIITHLLQFTNQYFDFYTIYGRDYAIKEFGFGFGLNLLILLIVATVTTKDENINNNLITKVVILSILIAPLSLVIPLITRLNYYFLPLMLIAFPITFDLIKNKLTRTIFILLIVSFTLYSYTAFYTSPIHGPYFKVYKTFFSSPLLNQ